MAASSEKAKKGGVTTAFRLAPAHLPTSNTPWSGEGTRIYGGRWVRRGLRVAYASATRSLAILEMKVQTGPLALRYRCFCMEIPDTHILTVSENALPAGWRGLNAYPLLEPFGDAWIKAGKFPVMAVPSAVLPQELNYLVWVDHPAFAALKTWESEIVDSDPRLMPGAGTP